MNVHINSNNCFFFSNRSKILKNLHKKKNPRYRKEGKEKSLTRPPGRQSFLHLDGGKVDADRGTWYIRIVLDGRLRRNTAHCVFRLRSNISPSVASYVLFPRSRAARTRSRLLLHEFRSRCGHGSLLKEPFLGDRDGSSINGVRGNDIFSTRSIRNFVCNGARIYDSVRGSKKIGRRFEIIGES